MAGGSGNPWPGFTVGSQPLIMNDPKDVQMQTGDERQPMAVDSDQQQGLQQRVTLGVPVKNGAEWYSMPPRSAQEMESRLGGAGRSTGVVPTLPLHLIASAAESVNRGTPKSQADDQSRPLPYFLRALALGITWNK